MLISGNGSRSRQADEDAVYLQERCALSPYLQGSYCLLVARFFNLHARTETMAMSIARPSAGLKPISGFVPATKIVQLESDWRIDNRYPLLPVV